MMKRTMFAMLGLAFVMMLAAPSQAHARVFVSVQVGPVVSRPAYVAVRPYPYYYRPVVVRPVFYRPAPVFVRPAPVFFYRGRWCPRPYAHRGYVGPRYYRH